MKITITVDHLIDEDGKRITYSCDKHLLDPFSMFVTGVMFLDLVKSLVSTNK